MKELVLKIKTKDDSTACNIMYDLSKYDCDYNLVKEDKNASYSPMYKDLPYARLGDNIYRTNIQYRKDMEYYRSLTDVLMEFGLPNNQIGFKYIIESVRLINTYGMEGFSLNKDIYPIIAKWYLVSTNSVEHNIRNCINCGWFNYQNNPHLHNDMEIFDKKPTNMKFLKYVAKISAYVIAEAS